MNAQPRPPRFPHIDYLWRKYTQMALDAVARTPLSLRPLRARAAQLAGKQPLHCFGDSHVLVFKEIRRRRLLPKTWIDVVKVRGATALGMVNPNSQTHALPIFRSVISRLPTDRRLLFLLGEVDCGYLIWYRARRLNVPVEDQLRESLERYQTFLASLIDEGRRDLIVTGAPPPTILDDQPQGETADARREIEATLLERTALTLRYNSALREWCDSVGVRFLGYDDEVIDPATRVVREDLRNPNPLDAHLAVAPYATVLAAHLRSLGFS